jgi:hypothetical protein
MAASANAAADAPRYIRMHDKYDVAIVGDLGRQLRFLGR